MLPASFYLAQRAGSTYCHDPQASGKHKNIGTPKNYSIAHGVSPCRGNSCDLSPTHDPFHMTLTHDDAGHVCPSFLHNCYNCSYSGLSSDGHMSMGLLMAVSIPP